MSRNAVTEDLVRGQTKRLKMPGLARSFEALARQAREEAWTHEEFLHEALGTEITSREQSAARSEFAMRGSRRSRPSTGSTSRSRTASTGP